MNRYAILFLILVSSMSFAAEKKAHSPSAPNAASKAIDTELTQKESDVDASTVLNTTETLKVTNPSDLSAPTTSTSPNTGLAAGALSNQKLSGIKETEIPVNLEPAKKSGNTDSPWLRMFGGLVIVGILSLGAMFYIRKIKKVKAHQGPTPEIKVLTQHHLGPKKSLAIIRVAGESILVGITDQNINLLKSLSLLDEDIPEQVPQSFNSVFNEDSGEVTTPSRSAKPNKSSNLDSEDEFSISGIKDVVTARLKNMRNFQ